MMGITKTQLDLLDYIESHIGMWGFAPTIVEMKYAMDVKSTSNIHRMVRALEERGRIRRLPNRARAIEIIPQAAASS
jgi:repressor LexA